MRLSFLWTVLRTYGMRPWTPPGFMHTRTHYSPHRHTSVPIKAPKGCSPQIAARFETESFLPIRPCDEKIKSVPPRIPRMPKDLRPGEHTERHRTRRSPTLQLSPHRQGGQAANSG